MTYAASTLLNDLYSQIAMELPSLGFYTWGEHRYKLSNTKDVIIGARKEADWWRNTCHLGIKFDQSSPEQDTVYS